MANIVIKGLHDFLEDIVNNIAINSNFCIEHPDYLALNCPQDSLHKYRQLSPAVQNKYLYFKLRDFLYEIYFSGQRTRLQENDLELNLNDRELENNTVSGLNLEFYDRLQASNYSKGYFDRDWRLVRVEKDKTLAVIKDNLTLHIDREHHLSTADRSTKEGEIVSVFMPNHFIDNEYYIAVGNVGKILTSTAIEIYFNVDAVGAIELMKNITEKLNSIDLPFTFKALYEPTNYYCYDTAVLQVDRSDYTHIRSILEKIYQENREHFRSYIPLFTKYLAAGISLTELPDKEESERISFGMNRCQIIANALLEARKQGNELPKNRSRLIYKHFSKHGINLDFPYLNPNSKDIYEFSC